MNFILFVSFFYFFIFFIGWNTPVSADSLQAQKQEKDPRYRDFDFDWMWSFNLKLLKNLMKEAEFGENVLISPWSTAAALMSLIPGAGDRTRREIEKILFSSTRSDMQANSSYIPAHLLYAPYHSRGQNCDSWEYNLNVGWANGIFLQKDIPFFEEYKKEMEEEYHSDVTNVDYHKGNETTNLINKWISEKTCDRISKLFDHPIDPDTVALLISTFYFKGKWEKNFPDSSTKMEKFNTGSAEIDVPMMRNTQVVKYKFIPLLQTEVIALDYADRNETMFILLPYRSQSLKNLTNHLLLFDPYEFDKKAKDTLVDYKIPKMKLNWRRSFVDALNAPAIFSNPDLSNMVSKPMNISDMLHATEIEVNENGTTASTVANAQIKKLGAASVPKKKPIRFYVNRPFHMQILDRESYSPLFSGLVYKPI